MASRILGMGDVMSLIEKAEQNFDEKQARELEQKIRSSKLNLNDFLEQMRQVSRWARWRIFWACCPAAVSLPEPAWMKSR